jgi:hypothetical protein
MGMTRRRRVGDRVTPEYKPKDGHEQGYIGPGKELGECAWPCQQFTDLTQLFSVLYRLLII